MVYIHKKKVGKCWLLPPALCQSSNCNIKVLIYKWQEYSYCVVGGCIKTSLSILVGVCEQLEVSLENYKMLRGGWVYWRHPTLWCLICGWVYWRRPTLWCLICGWVYWRRPTLWCLICGWVSFDWRLFITPFSIFKHIVRSFIFYLIAFKIFSCPETRYF